MYLLLQSIIIYNFAIKIQKKRINSLNFVKGKS